MGGGAADVEAERGLWGAVPKVSRPKGGFWGVVPKIWRPEEGFWGVIRALEAGLVPKMGFYGPLDANFCLPRRPRWSDPGGRTAGSGQIPGIEALDLALGLSIWSICADPAAKFEVRITLRGVLPLPSHVFAGLRACFWRVWDCSVRAYGL